MADVAKFLIVRERDMSLENEKEELENKSFFPVSSYPPLFPMKKQKVWEHLLAGEKDCSETYSKLNYYCSSLLPEKLFKVYCILKYLTVGNYSTI